MKTVEHMRMIICLAVLTIAAMASVAHAEPTFGNMSSAGFRIVNGGMSSVGGIYQTADQSLKVTASNMYPYQKEMTSRDYKPYYDQSIVAIQSGKTYINTISLVNVAPSETGIGRLILYPAENYGSEKVRYLLEDGRLANVESSLINARDILAYGLQIGYTDPVNNVTVDSLKAKLLDSIKTLANVYLMIGDEFFIDALEYRFSPSAVTAALKLQEQICLLGYGTSEPSECVISSAYQYGAQYYYEKAVQSFVYGFFPASLGHNVYISDYFDEPTFALFNLSSERLSSALREKSSKQFVLTMSPDPLQEWAPARQVALETLRSSSTDIYLTAAAASDNAVKKGMDFSINGGDTLVATLTTLRRQGNLLTNNNLNPLGYDKRHVPMYPLEDLLVLVQNDIKAAESAQVKFDAAKRDMDADVNAMRTELNSLMGSYTDRLFSLTGCNAPILGDAQSVEDFKICVVPAGGDLLTCDVKVSQSEFNDCMNTIPTTQALRDKYQNVYNAKLRLDQARLNRQNILAQISMETELHKNMINLKYNFVGQQLMLMDVYFEKLKNVRTETDTETITVTKEWDKKKKKWVDMPKTKTHTTQVSFNSGDTLRINTDKEKEFLEATTKYEVQVAEAELANRIKNLLLNEASAEMEVSIAAQQKNVAVADFDDAVAQKEYYWTLFERSLSQIQNYYTARIPTERVLKSQAAIDLSAALNRATHSAYLAAKAQEYKYVSPIEKQVIPGGNLSMSDLYKAQTSTDLQLFLDGLNKLNVLKCPYGSPSKQLTNYISIARDVLRLSPSATAAQKQKAMKDFLDMHTIQGGVEFPFTITSYNPYLLNQGKSNLKIWGGNPPEKCNDFADPSNPPRGVTVIVETSQIADNFPPIFKLGLSGHSTLTDALGKIQDYIPAYSYALMLSPEKENPTIYSDEQNAYVNSSPLFPPNGLGGWVNTFKARGMASPGWTLKLTDLTGQFDFKGGQIKDIYIHLDTISLGQ